MIFRPAHLQNLAQALALASQRGTKIERVDLGAFNRLLEHTPEDMTVTVEAGLDLATLQTHLARHNQWLPIDPPFPQSTSVAELLNANLSGPRRFGYGTIREHLLGLQVVLADGRVIKCGGKVVKNVAGYDLCKLFVGSQGTLGVTVAATFKLQPRPELELFLAFHCDSLRTAGALCEAIFDSEITPVVLDLHNLSLRNSENPATCTLVLGFAGTREDVEWQVAKASALGAAETSDLNYDELFREQNPKGDTHQLSMLPSQTAARIQNLGAVPFVARAGNGSIFYRGGNAPVKPELPAKLLRQIKDTYDPNHVLPELSL